jgi:CRP-like cAMP-binding protein
VFDEKGQAMLWTRTRDAKVQRLRQLSLLRSCADDEVRRLAAAGELVELPAGAVVQRRGAAVEWLALPVEGLVSGPGEREAFVGQTAVLAGTPSPHDIVAGTDALVLVVGRREFRALMDTAPGIRSAVITAMARTVVSTPAGHEPSAEAVGQVYQLPVRPLVSAS